MKYKLSPSRNKICFSGNPDFNSLSKLLNVSLFKVIQFFSTLIDFTHITCQFESTNYGDVCLEINTINPIDHAKFIDHIQFLKINNIILKNNFVKDLIFGFTIIRSPLSFHQNDNNIRYPLYTTITTICANMTQNIDNLYFIGGEMYIFGVILKKFYNCAYFYSDYQSIVDDTLKNIPNQKNCHLIDYKNLKFNNYSEKKDCCSYNIALINNGKAGFGKELCNEILRSGIFNKIFIISCNQKSFDRDFNILKSKYFIDKQFTFETNYIINFFILTQK